jgi:signal transduction histidine kinase
MREGRRIHPWVDADPPRARAGRRYARCMSMERAVDIGVAVGVFLLTLALLAGGGVSGDEDARGLDALGVLLAAGASLPLVVRRRAPLAAFALSATASTFINALHYGPGPPVGPTVALFFLGLSPAATRTGLRATAATVFGFYVAHVVAAGIGRDQLPLVAASFGAVVWGGAWVVGDRVRLRRERVAQLEERARRAELEAARERRLAAAEERTRIARDLHDSAGHAINVILVQAGAARLLGEKDPARARGALETIESVARETLTEIERMVRVLRDDAPPPDGDGSIELPTGLAALGSIAQRHRAAGLEVALSVEGSQRSLPRAVDQAAYRIVQESLTNALLHGQGPAAVKLTFGADELEIDVANPFSGNDSAGAGGHGIVGMRERAHLVGGSLDLVRDDGVFRVRARLPYAGKNA